MPSVAAPDLVAPAYSWVPDHDDTDGPLVAELCESVGFAPDLEQRLLLDATFATRAGRSIRDIGVCGPRQNLKTGFLKMATLGWLFISDLRLVVWSAHEFRTSQEAFRDMCNLIEDSPDLDREVLRTSRGKTGISRGNGDEAIELRGDRRLVFKARTKSGGRGLTGDRVVLDEAMLLKADMMAALIPTLRARPDPQVVFAGSAGLLESDIWRAVRDRGRSGGDPSLAWLEWGDRDEWSGCADECPHVFGVEGCAMDDEARWWASNPALRSGRVTVESLRADRRLLPPVKFATETLGWWEDPPTSGTDSVLSGWSEARTAEGLAGRLVLGVDVSTDLRSAAIVACDGSVVEVVDYRPRSGIRWVSERVAELRQRHQDIVGVGVAASSPAMAIAGGLPDVLVVPSGQQSAACAAFAQSVNEGGLRHHGADGARGPLDVAVESAVRALSGDGWRWSRRASTADISPLWAAVVAAHLAREMPPAALTAEELLRSFG